MRIVCPGCDAQYEVPDEVIPAEGREVQCSNCSNTWLFGPPAQAEAGPAPGGDDAGAAEPDRAEDAFAGAPRRELDPKVASILRAEAARETAARAADAGQAPLEMQPELGLTEGPRPRRTAEAPAVADAPPETPARRSRPGNMTVAAASAASGSRRARLPDIEDINASLRSTDREATGEAARPATEDRARRRRGFRLGLFLSLLIFALCLLAYQFAPEIAASVPQADPWISSYVTWVDETRALLDARLRQMLEWLDAQATAPDA